MPRLPFRTVKRHISGDRTGHFAIQNGPSCNLLCTKHLRKWPLFVILFYKYGSRKDVNRKPQIGAETMTQSLERRRKSSIYTIFHHKNHIKNDITPLSPNCPKKTRAALPAQSKTFRIFAFGTITKPESTNLFYHRNQHKALRMLVIKGNKSIPSLFSSNEQAVSVKIRPAFSKKTTKNHYKTIYEILKVIAPMPAFPGSGTR